MTSQGPAAPRTPSRWRRRLEVALVALALGTVAALLVVYFRRGFVPGDAYTYLAAGERLNAGHQLYALSPGDRPVGLKPPYWTVPLLSPPLIGVLWRPLALLPLELGVYLWWAAMISSIVGVVLVTLRRRPIAGSMAVLALSIPITYEIGVGNVNGLLLAGLVCVWWLVARGREVAAGALLAILVAVKLMPAVFVVWLLVSRRWMALVGVALGGLACAIVSLAGAGFDAHLRYLAVIGQTMTGGTSDLSLAGLGRSLGLPQAVAATLPALGAIFGLVGLFVFRGRPAVGFVVAVVAMVSVSPVMNINTPTLLLAALAPAILPARVATGGEAGDQFASSGRAAEARPAAR